MPDRLSAAELRPAVLQALLAIAVLAATGALAGVVWYWVWTPPMGVVSGHDWLAKNEAGLRGQFSATGWYVVVATVAGLLAGAVVALFLDRVPLVTLVAVVVGSAIGAWLMLEVGAALGPADPRHLARTAEDGTRLPGNLAVTGRSPWVSLPAGALVALALVFFGVGGRRRDVAESRHDTASAG